MKFFIKNPKNQIFDNALRNLNHLITGMKTWRLLNHFWCKSVIIKIHYYRVMVPMVPIKLVIYFSFRYKSPKCSLTWNKKLVWTNNLPAMYRNWSLLAELFLCFMNLSYEINESLSWFRNTLFWPISELELSDCTGLTILLINVIIRYALSA